MINVNQIILINIIINNYFKLILFVLDINKNKNNYLYTKII